MLREMGLQQLVEDSALLTSLKSSVASQEARCEKWAARLKYMDAVLRAGPAAVEPVKKARTSGLA
ncbi:hypothetical protein LINPERHAP2_LOCUS13114, partial [Linum perenne]